MGTERGRIDARFERLLEQEKIAFLMAGKPLVASRQQGVYVIRDLRETVLHVGRTLRSENGLYQRLYDHLYGRSSFVFAYFGGDGAKLRGTHTYQVLPEANARMRALLEAHSISQLCPKHLGTGEE